jgi:peptidoglycan hydrolase-like protein with peptidoglycan-binding domain
LSIQAAGIEEGTTMAGEPQLSEGSDGQWVSHLQTILEARGFDPGPIDGIFGPRTEAAVKAYQEAYGLKVDGIVGPITWGSLNEGEEPEEDDEDVTIWASANLEEEGFQVSNDEMLAEGFDPTAYDDEAIA